MNIHSLYRHWQPIFRARRWALFLELFKPTAETRILDVGGNPRDWMDGVPIEVRVTILNIGRWPTEWQIPDRFTEVIGDGRALPYSDREFEIAYSSSVIEHLNRWEDQQRFAREIRRVGRSVYVQTPNRWFPVEPHFGALFVHWLPMSVRRVLMPWVSVRGWLPSADGVDDLALMEEVRLLSFREMRALFPDCEIYRERWLGLTKSFIAIRRPSAIEEKTGEFPGF